MITSALDQSLSWQIILMKCIFVGRSQKRIMITWIYFKKLVHLNHKSKLNFADSNTAKLSKVPVFIDNFIYSVSPGFNDASGIGKFRISILIEAHYLLVLLTVFCFICLTYGILLCICHATICFDKFGSKRPRLENDPENPGSNPSSFR